MSELRVIFQTDNAEFEGTEEQKVYQLATALHRAFVQVKAATMEDLKNGLTFRDLNGNAIGRAQYIDRAFDSVSIPERRERLLDPNPMDGDK